VITHATTLDSPLGTMRLGAEGDALAGIWFPDHRHPVDLGGAADGAKHPVPVLVLAQRQLREWFEGERRTFDLPLAQHGTAFQKRVWDALLEIPFGETWTYTQLAARAGRPAAMRAAGSANGRNPFSIVVPCHRVIGSDGSLTGYAGGLRAKEWLLAHERRLAAARKAS
jgi:methylated-DNA-[protein]-cysteine S-methyltransferase